MPASLRLEDFHDFELAHAWREAADENELASAAEVAVAVGLDAERPAQNVGSRFAAMKRFGLMETVKSPKGETLWRMTEIGQALFFGRGITGALAARLDRMTETERIRLLDDLAGMLPNGSREAAHVARRAWRNRFGGWRDETFYPRRNGSRRRR